MHQKTRETYNRSADQLSSHYNDIGAREGDIGLAFALAGDPENPVVLEIGCGNGRDAEAILAKTYNYTGIDISERMIDKASRRLPEVHFVVADCTQYQYSGPYDIIFAFATFRHLNRTELQIVMGKAYDSLRQGGILYISAMYGEEYGCMTRNDTYGDRDMYLYNPDLLLKNSPKGFSKVQEIYDTIDENEWFELALKKQL